MGKKKKEKNKPTKQKNIDLSKNGVGNDSTPQIRYDRKGRRKY